MKLCALAGQHVLTGVDRSNQYITDIWGNRDWAEHCSFVLDGVTYTAIEDPDDGYRSMMSDLIVSDTPLTTTFDPVPVVGVYLKQGTYGDLADILRLIHAETGDVILEVGTDNLDDYYPQFVSFYDPTALGFPELTEAK